MTASRDANLLVIALSPHAHSIQVGLGVSPEVIQTPSISIPTIVYVNSEGSQSKSSRALSDYSFEPEPDLISMPLFSIEPRRGPQLSQSNPLVTDWQALDAFFRHLLFDRLRLSKPPLAHHILLSIPPNIPNPTRDKLTRLFFESLQASALLLVESPLLNVLACNCTNGITIDIGARSTLVGFVYDSIVQHQSCHLYPVGEQDCDDYLISLLLNENPELPAQLGWSSSDQAGTLYHALLAFISNLKADGHIRFEPQLDNIALAKSFVNSEEEENGISDVAQAIVSGKVDKIIGKQNSNGLNQAARRPLQTGKLQAEVLKETDTIVILNSTNSQHNLNPSTPSSPLLDCQPSQATPVPTEPVLLPPENVGIRISKTRHRHSEPLFAPKMLSSIPPIFARFGLEKYATRYTNELLADDDTLVESISQGINKILSPEMRKEIVAQFVLTGRGGLMCRTEGLGIGISSGLQSKHPIPTSNLSQHPSAVPSSSSNPTESLFKPLKVPEYFSEFKGKPEYLEFLGGCIVAKLGFNDSSSAKLWISKSDYGREGAVACRRSFVAPSAF